MVLEDRKILGGPLTPVTGFVDADLRVVAQETRFRLRQSQQTTGRF
jgi:hypothetical protein